MRKTAKDYLFVGIQTLLFFALLGDLDKFQFEAGKTVRVIGGILFFIGFVISATAVLQLNRNLSPFPSPKLGAHLIKNGLYKYIRHPIYSGVLAVGIGLGLATVSGSRLMVVVLRGSYFITNHNMRRIG